MLAQVRTPSGATCKHVSSSCVFVMVRDLQRYSKDPGSSPGGDT